MLRFGLLVAGLTIVGDQLSKWAILSGVFGLPFWAPEPGFPWAQGVTLTGFFNLVTVWNRGVSFGLFTNSASMGPIVLSLVAIAISAGLVVWLRKAENRFLAFGLGLVIGGAIGNVIDRFRFGAVFDFLDFHAFGYHWPAFNVADTGITVGVGLILLDGVFARDAAQR